MIKNPPPEMTEVPSGCTTVKWGRMTYVCDPTAALVPGERVALSGSADFGRHGTVPIDIVGFYLPKPELTAKGTVRFRAQLQFLELPCPPWRVAKVVGYLVPTGRRSKDRRPKPGGQSLRNA